MSQDTAGEAAAAPVRLELESGYRFEVDLGEQFAPLSMDEPPPLGEGTGPNAAAVLAAAVGNCLSASLLYCLRRAHIEIDGLTAEVETTKVRDGRGRLRIGAMRVTLHPEVAGANEHRLGRCLELFEDFCVVTESVRHGIEVAVAVDLGQVAGPPTPDSGPGTGSADA